MSTLNSQDLIATTVAFISKSSSLLFNAPFDRAMTVIQTQGTIKNLQTPYKGVLNCLVRLYREEGFWHLWRGTSAALIANIPKVFSFPLKDIFKSTLPHYDPRTQYTKFFIANILGGALAGSTTSLFSYPLDLIRVQLASDLGKEKKDRQFSGVRDCFGKIYQNSGIRGLYRGFLLPFVSIAVYRGWYFGVYDSVAKLIPRDNFFAKFLFAQGVTISAGLITYPFETLRKRMCMQGGRVEPDYKHAIDCAKKMVEKEGVRSLFRGFLFKIGFGISGALALTIYDSVKSDYRQSI